jgi:hypothetical protein
MTRLRQWDNRSSQWFSRSFSIALFQMLLGMVFFFFVNIMLDVFSLGTEVKKATTVEQLLFSQSELMLLVVVLLIFNSFLMLYLFSNLLRIRGVLKNIDYSLGRRSDKRDED